jgi:glycosyltransferase involved in cell wall biosynthesis
VISFIVPAYNEGRLLGPTLAAIHEAGRALTVPYELIVVNDASTDDTVAIARAHGARVVDVQYRQIARVRNAGASVANGSVFIFIDADTIVSPSTVRATLAALNRGAAGGGATVAFEGRLPLWARLVNPGFSVVMRIGRLAAGCYVFCSRRAFNEVGGFDETLYAAEEIAFSRTLRRKGPVVILRERVTTSGRKLRSHSGWEVLRLCAGLLGRGTAMLRTRDRLSIWYGERRDDR